MSKSFGIAILGGSGYGAGELVRMLSFHPEIEVCSITSRSHAGKPISSIHSHLAGITSLAFESAPALEKLSAYKRSAIVLAMPTGQAVPAVTTLLNDGLPNSTSIVDLSGDLRLTDQATHERFYPEVAFSPEIRSRFTYGLTELARTEIASSRFIANPGCLSSAAILALAPLRGVDLVGPVIVDAKTGTSGAGREPQASMHHPSRSADFTAYKALQHRHEPEILQALGDSFKAPGDLMFVPHLLPVSRGIFVSAYVTLANAADAQGLTERYKRLYADSPFVRFRSSPPRLVDVVGTNFCDISIAVRDKQAVVMATLDNLGKGMVGSAIQNLNLMFGLPENTGLLLPAIGPA